MRNLKAFYLKVKQELRVYLLETAVITGTGNPDILLQWLDEYLNRLNEEDFSDIHFRYYITE